MTYNTEKSDAYLKPRIITPILKQEKVKQEKYIESDSSPKIYDTERGEKYLNPSREAKIWKEHPKKPEKATE